jgi:putative radical SAM enzyme (TIGR03279 family)
VEEDSIAHDLGLRPGDRLKKINDHDIHDIIDYRFYVSDEELDITVVQNGEKRLYLVEKEADEELGIAFEGIQYKCCGNKCIFCFVDQNPDNLRKDLYFKDEDFRLSFLHGNYVTLTNIRDADVERIVEQRLTPLYVSVHAVDPEVRRRMLGIRRDDKLLEKIEFLTNNRIEIHAQIVLCPGINDGDVLGETIEKLSAFHPWIRSIAIVPVGLTRHRRGLYPLQAMTKDSASSLIDWIDSRAEKFHRKMDSHFIYLADEIYLLAKRDIPPAGRYDEFHQYENGVGMLRYFMDDFAEQSEQFPRSIPSKHLLRLVTGELAHGFIGKTVVPRLNEIGNLIIDAVAVKNNFYGDSVKVSGLLTGADIFESLKDKEPVDTVLLPGNCINHSGLFLDDWTIDILEEKLGSSVRVMSLDFIELLNELK